MLITNFRLKYVLYKIVCGAYQLVDTGRIHPVRERALRALQRSVDYIESAMPDALGLENQRDLINYSLKVVGIDGHYLEFGVFTGGTIRYIAHHIGSRTIHGFDSFEGLPEAWSGFGLGGKSFDVKGRLPRVPDNARLHQGYFDESLPSWLADNPGPVAFIHIDCDLYSSTKTILESARARGSWERNRDLLFDEYFNYPNWERHEFKASPGIRSCARGVANITTYLAFARTKQVAVRVDSGSEAGSSRGRTVLFPVDVTMTPPLARHPACRRGWRRPARRRRSI